MFEEYKLRNYNFKLLIMVLTAVIFGTVMINSADSSYLEKQIIGATICIIGLVILSLISYKFISKFYIVLYAFNILMLVSVRLFGIEVNGAQRWLGNQDYIMIQPSEFSKIIMRLYLI